MAQGQFGKVYCAVHRASGRLVALKLVDRQRSTTSQFLRELSSLLTLSHPALTQLRAIEQTDAGRCLVLDYSAGGTLRQLLESPSVPCQKQLLQCLVQVLGGLDHAHDRGIVHCDVKPENILMQLEPKGWKACLTDFGIAQSDVIVGSPEFDRGGSPAYMAPERFDGEAYPASDLYSMGIILYEVLLGDRPFHGSPNELREAHRQERVKFSKLLPLAFQTLLFRALSKAPDLRYDSARLMAQDLQQALVELPQLAEESDSQGWGDSLFPLMPSEPLLTWPVAVSTKSFSADPLLAQSTASKEAVAIKLASISPLLRHPSEGNAAALEMISSDEPLENRTAIAVNMPQLWVSQGSTVQGLSLELEPDQACAVPHGEDLARPIRLTFPEAVTALALSSSYGFASTSTALYRWPLVFQSEKNGTQESGTVELADALSANEGFGTDGVSFAEKPAVSCLYQGQVGLSQLALSPQAEWGALVQRSPLGQASLLILGLGLGDPAAKCTCRELKLRSTETLMGVLLLDRRHGAALIASDGMAQRLGLFSRRGQWLSYFTLPVSLTYWVRGNLDYELWALELGHPKMLLQLGLKPFRIQRIPLAIAPDQIYPLPWGCVLANQQGQILLLNREGQSLGQLQAPLLPETLRLWLMPLAPHLLVIVLQQPHGLKLLPLDLRDLELMLVF